MSKIPPEQMKTADYWKTSQIGTGPFKWNKYTPGESTELVRFDNYWRGKPKLDGIIRRHFKDPAAALIAFDAGEIQFTYLTADEVERERATRTRSSCPATPAWTTASRLNPNVVPEFGKPEVRQALLMAIDRQSIVDNIYGGAANIVPCLYGLPNLTGSVAPQAVRSRQAPRTCSTRPAWTCPSSATSSFDTYYATRSPGTS